MLRMPKNGTVYMVHQPPSLLST